MLTELVCLGVGCIVLLSGVALKYTYNLKQETARILTEEEILNTIRSVVIENMRNSDITFHTTRHILARSISDSSRFEVRAINTKRLIPIENNAEACPICYEANNASSCRPSCCVHVFHTACLNRWAERESNCPVCRRSF